jgi:thioesterase domain-containing protein
MDEQCSPGDQLSSTGIGQMASESSPVCWLRRAGKEPTHVWIHPSGGGIECYRPLAQAMPFRALAIDSSVLRTSDSPAATVQEFAADYLGHLERVGLTGHIVLAGWSFGGVVAFEMATQLARQGRPVAQVVLIDSFVGETLPSGPWKTTRPPTDTRVSARERQKVQQAHLVALQQHRPEHYCGPVLSVRAVPIAGDPDSVWRDAAPDLQIHQLQADHFSIMSDSMKEAVLSAISMSRETGSATLAP